MTLCSLVSLDSKYMMVFTLLEHQNHIAIREITWIPHLCVHFSLVLVRRVLLVDIYSSSYKHDSWFFVSCV